MTKTVLITRPKGDEAPLTDLLHEQGYSVIHEPLTEIFLKHDQRFALEQALHAEPDAVIVTSKHGALALSLLSDLRDLPLLCVGEVTASAAEDVGFTRVSSAGGTVERLIEYIGSAYDEGTRFLYASAEHTRADLVAALAQLQMEVERVVVYEAVAATQLSDTLAEQLRRGQIDAVTFMSARSAGIFMELAGNAKLLPTLEKMQACCLSVAVAQPLHAQPWGAIAIAGDATLASLVQCVDNALH